MLTPLTSKLRAKRKAEREAHEGEATAQTLVPGAGGKDNPKPYSLAEDLPDPEKVMYTLQSLFLDSVEGDRPVLFDLKAVPIKLQMPSSWRGLCACKTE